MTYQQWHELPEYERLDRLAFEYRRRDFIHQLLIAFDERTKEDKGNDQTAYILTLLAEHL